MHLVFVCYYSFACNSAGHIACLGNALVQLGNKVTVFVPFDSASAKVHGEVGYEARLFSELDSWLTVLPAEEEVILIAWTPRENVRQFVEKFQQRLPCRYVVHLEDNEKLITTVNLGESYESLEKLSAETLTRRIGPDQRLSHPHHFPRFLAKADGLTLLMDKLDCFAQPGQSVHVFWPGYNSAFFRQRPINYAGRRALGVGDEEVVLAYTGNAHSANRREIMSLYLAVTILNRLGIKSRLLRTGEDYVQLLTQETSEVKNHIIELGLLPSQAEVADVVAMADILVQPGRSDPFNDFRFPSKLPEFFALGRPVLIPAANLGRFVQDGEDCIVLQRGDAFEIAEKIQALRSDPRRIEALSENAVRFAQHHFQWPAIARNYFDFLRGLPIPDSVIT
jgi:glycosyltransferase involved in cell wall biosynthesis